jgi:DNA-binding Xre family transcriptional regulator
MMFSMIKNEKQYNTSRKKLAEIEQVIAKEKPLAKSSLQKELYLVSLTNIKKQLQSEINAYLRKKRIGISLNKEVSVNRLPQVLIDYKIAKKLSQKAFSAILGIKEQQLQRYEADKYSSVSFKRLISFVEKTDLKIMISVKNA